MDSIPEILTPKNKCRSLGLKRSIQKTTVTKTPLTDVKINYKSLQNKVETAASPSTPSLQQTLPQKISAHTTNCLPYRLSLSRRMRNNYKKKKLEFTACAQVAEIDNLAKNSTSTCHNEKRPDILQEIINKEKILETHKKHQGKVQELNNLINIWKEAFKSSLEELSSKLEPKMETEDLIARLGIPSEMIEYT